MNAQSRLWTSVISVVIVGIFVLAVGADLWLSRPQSAPDPLAKTTTEKAAKSETPSETVAAASGTAPTTGVPVTTSPPTSTPTSTFAPTGTPTPKSTRVPTEPPVPTPTLSVTDTPVPTATSTSAPTVTPNATSTIAPSPTPTPIPTSTKAPTSTTRPTSTPSLSPATKPTSTHTPIRTDRPTSTKTPTRAPTPTLPPDAVVNATDGVALYSGPEYPSSEVDYYHEVYTLPYGTVLNVLRRVHNKDSWIKVAVNSETDERIEGYVNIGSGSIEVNGNLEDVPPIYEFGPPLLMPEESAQRALDDLTQFRWEDYGMLQEYQYYSLIIYRTDFPEEQSCYHDQYKVPEVLLKLEDYELCTPGVYYWGVGIATEILGEDGKLVLDDDGKPLWRDDSERDHRRIIGLDVEPPRTNEDRHEGTHGDPNHPIN